MEIKELQANIEAILFASGDPVPAQRVAKVLDTDEERVFAAAELLAQEYLERGSGIRLLRLDGKLQLCSAPEYSQNVTRALEQRRPPRLSPSALEALAIVAYFQPVTRAYVDQVRGVDSSYTMGVLLERGLIEAKGRLDVPGRPTVYGTGDIFLRTMNISSLDELPELPDTNSDEGIIALQNKIDEMQSGQLEGQMSFGEDIEPAQPSQDAQ